MSRTSRRMPRVARMCASTAAAAMVFGAPALVAAPTAGAAPHSSGDCDPGNERCEDIQVYSPSMDREITVQVLAPADEAAPAPVMYLLNGAGGGEDNTNWPHKTDVADFFSDKHSYVAIPREGAFSYYTDWNEPDENLGEGLDNNGVNKWETFLAEELPAYMDTNYNTTDKRGLVGMSMSGSSVLDLAIQRPEAFSAVGSFSGCTNTSDPIGSNFVNLIVGFAGGGDVTKMWGPVGGPQWVEHDVFANAERLPDIPIYVATGTGMPGVHENLDDPRVDGSEGLAGTMITGGAIEGITGACTGLLQSRTDAAGMDNIQYHYFPGTHSWGYWEDNLHESWPMFAGALETQ